MLCAGCFLVQVSSQDLDLTEVLSKEGLQLRVGVIARSSGCPRKSVGEASKSGMFAQIVRTVLSM